MFSVRGAVTQAATGVVAVLAHWVAPFPIIPGVTRQQFCACQDICTSKVQDTIALQFYVERVDWKLSVAFVDHVHAGFDVWICNNVRPPRHGFHCVRDAFAVSFLRHFSRIETNPGVFWEVSHRY